MNRAGKAAILFVTLCGFSSAALADVTTRPATPKIAPRMAKKAHLITPPSGDPIHDTDEAVELLSSKVEKDRTAAASWLSSGKTDDVHRAEILKLLDPELKDVDPRRSLVFVQAYANWADRAHAADIAAVFDEPVIENMPAAREKCWAAALEALARLDEKLADDMLAQRIDVFFFRAEAARALQPLADSDTTAAETAKRLINVIKLYNPDKTAPHRDAPSPQPEKSAGGNKQA